MAMVNMSAGLQDTNQNKISNNPSRLQQVSNHSTGTSAPQHVSHKPLHNDSTPQNSSKLDKLQHESIPSNVVIQTGSIESQRPKSSPKATLGKQREH